MRKICAFSVVSSALLALTSPAHASQVLDQFNIPIEPSGQAIANDFHLNVNNQPLFLDLAGLQTVTAGKTGFLTQVDLQLAKAGPASSGFAKLLFGKNVTFAADGSIASGVKLGELAIDLSKINDFANFTEFDTSGLGIFLNSGDHFAIALEPAQSNDFQLFLWGFGGNSYAGGQGYNGASPAKPDDDDYGWNATPGMAAPRDLGFRTWMTAVPEPATWTLMSLGFGAIGGGMRRQRSKVRFVFA